MAGFYTRSVSTHVVYNVGLLRKVPIEQLEGYPVG
jgi:hypothetical protein